MIMQADDVMKTNEDHWIVTGRTMKKERKDSQREAKPVFNRYILVKRRED